MFADWTANRPRPLRHSSSIQQKKVFDGSDGLGSVPVWTEPVPITGTEEVLRRLRVPEIPFPKSWKLLCILKEHVEDILLYFDESLLLYFECILVYFESLLLQIESIILYFESILLYFEIILV